MTGGRRQFVRALFVTLQLAALALVGCGGGTKRATVDGAENAGDDPSSAVGEPAGGPAPSEDERRLAAIEHVVNDTEPARHLCWELAAAETLGTEGQVLLSIGFGAGGSVRDVAVVEETVDDERVVDCLTEVYTRYPWPRVFANGESIELPFTFTAPRAQYVVRRDLARRYEATSGLAATIIIDRKNSGQDRASLTALSMPAGLEVPMHRHSSTEVLWVESGDGYLIDLDGKERAVATGDAIYIAAGVAHGFRAGPAGAAFIQVYGPAGAEQRFKDGLPSDTSPVDDDERKRPAKGFPRAQLAKSGQRFALPAGSVELFFDREATADGGASFATMTMPGGATVPAHAHDNETEVLFVRTGGGTMEVDGVSIAVAAGHGIAIPPGHRHGFVAGADGVEVLQVYTPSGPEQRFKTAR